MISLKETDVDIKECKKSWRRKTWQFINKLRKQTKNKKMEQLKRKKKKKKMTMPKMMKTENNKTAKSCWNSYKYIHKVNIHFSIVSFYFFLLYKPVFSSVWSVLAWLILLLMK